MGGRTAGWSITIHGAPRNDSPDYGTDGKRGRSPGREIQVGWTRFDSFQFFAAEGPINKRGTYNRAKLGLPYRDEEEEEGDAGTDPVEGGRGGEVFRSGACYAGEEEATRVPGGEFATDRGRDQRGIEGKVE